MTALDVATALGVPLERAENYLRTCQQVVESDQYVATLKGNTVHIAAKVNGLGGRKLLKDCRATLARWFELEPVLYAPVKRSNTKAIRLAEALGFHTYDHEPTDVLVWLMQTKEQYHA